MREEERRRRSKEEVEIVYAGNFTMASQYSVAAIWRSEQET